MRRYGAVALVMMLLAVGYARLRQRALEQQLLRRIVEQAQRRSRRSAKVAKMLALLSDQQAQYAQAVALLQKRVAKFQAAQHATAAPPAALQSAAALERQIELEALKQELLGLKGAVVDAFVHPRADAAAADLPLPPGWEARLSRSKGKMYFCNPALMLTQWDQPTVDTFGGTSNSSYGHHTSHHHHNDSGYGGYDGGSSSCGGGGGGGDSGGGGGDSGGGGGGGCD
ncbi:hypothetical protein PybrP1_008959 [[Pythium] brassicae (nom. inval.)]|nr:hypothetical protein PybrP1_008959 [[Pythium] brassicae (nom. inval.)]